MRWSLSKTPALSASQIVISVSLPASLTNHHDFSRWNLLFFPQPPLYNLISSKLARIRTLYMAFKSMHHIGLKLVTGFQKNMRHMLYVASRANKLPTCMQNLLFSFFQRTAFRHKQCSGFAFWTDNRHATVLCFASNIFFFSLSYILLLLQLTVPLSVRERHNIWSLSKAIIILVYEGS